MLSVALFAYRVRLSWNDSVDDVYIYVRYARNFAEHGQLAFNLGDPVEGFSSPIWMLMLGALWKFGAVGLTPARVLSVLCSMATIVVSFKTLRALKVQWASLWILAVMSLDCDLARWAVSGMDTPLLALGFSCVLLAAALEKVRLLAVTIGVLPWLRPEGLFVGGVLGVLLLAHSQTRRAAWLAIVPVALLVALRLSIFRDLLPNTFYAKMTTSGERVYSGFTYVWTFITRRPALTLLGAFAMTQGLRSSLAARVAIVTTIATFVFAWSAHGDWMANHRFLVPTLACLLVAAATLQKWVPIALVVLCAETFASTRRRLDQAWRGDEAVADALVTLVPDAIVKPEPLDWMPSHILRNLSYYVMPGETVAHVDMGQLPYVMHDVKFLDGFGLVDRDVAKFTYSPTDAKRKRVADVFFQTSPSAAVLVVKKSDEHPVTLGQMAFFSDPRFSERYREQSRVGTWGGNLCVIFVRRDRTAFDEPTAKRNEEHWLSAVPDVRSTL